jgi:hypothetical protein
MKTNPDFAGALGPIEYEIELRKVRGFESTPLSDEQLAAIKHALRIADALTRGASEAERDAFLAEWVDKEKRGVFIRSELYALSRKAMVNQLIKEAENAE